MNTISSLSLSAVVVCCCCLRGGGGGRCCACARGGGGGCAGCCWRSSCCARRVRVPRPAYQGQQCAAGRARQRCEAAACCRQGSWSLRRTRRPASAGHCLTVHRPCAGAGCWRAPFALLGQQHYGNQLLARSTTATSCWHAPMGGPSATFRTSLVVCGEVVVARSSFGRLGVATAVGEPDSELGHQAGRSGQPNAIGQRAAPGQQAGFAAMSSQALRRSQRLLGAWAARSSATGVGGVAASPLGGCASQGRLQQSRWRQACVRDQQRLARRRAGPTRCSNVDHDRFARAAATQARGRALAGSTAAGRLGQPPPGLDARLRRP